MTEERPKGKSPNEMTLTIKKLFPFLSKYKKWVIVGTIAVLVGIAISFLIGLGIRFVIDGFPEDPSEVATFLSDVLVVTLVVILFSNLMQCVAGYSLEKVAVSVVEDIRCKIFKNLTGQDLGYIERQSSGDMQTRIVADTSAVGGFLSAQIPTIFASTLMLIAGIAGAFYISAKMTFVVLACVPLIFLPFIILSKKLRILGKRVQTSIADVGRFSGEIFRNIKVVHAYNKENDENLNFSKLASVAADSRLSTSWLRIILNRIVETLAMTGFAILLWSAAGDIYTGNLTIGELVAFAYFALLIVRSAGSFFGVISSLNVVVGTAKKVLEYLEMEPNSWPSSAESINGQGEIEFKNVGFNYPNRADNKVLFNFNLQIKAGSHIALVGSSGAGKSTILELLLGFYEISEGNIYVDGTDIKLLNSTALRSSMGYVPQKESLISGNVFENISYGLSGADEQTVKAAAKMAYADEFIQKLPKGYDTDLGEVGSQLSGGQKQRISLARALIRDPQILLLDEAKSGLDTASERIVTKAIEQWAKKRKATVITITHSLETVQNADLIVVMDQGYIVGQGSHEDLLINCDVYQNLTFEDLKQVEDDLASSNTVTKTFAETNTEAEAV